MYELIFDEGRLLRGGRLHGIFLISIPLKFKLLLFSHLLLMRRVYPFVKRFFTFTKINDNTR